MELFGQNFLRIRNDYIIPQIAFGIQKSKVKYWGFKDTITSNLISLVKISNNAYEIEISKSDFYNSLHCDIELFLNKSYIQFNDLEVSKNNSPSWSFVTLYYFSFFSMTTFFRLLRKGFIFLRQDQANNLERFCLAMYSSPIKFSTGNYYFSYNRENAVGNVIINLSHKGEGVHKLSWIQLENTLRDFLPNCDSDEKIVLNSLLDFFSFFKSEFPSELRNKLNYHGESSLLDFEKKICHQNLKFDQKDLIKEILSVKNDDSIPNQMKAVSLLSVYLFKYVNELYKEYYSRSSFGNDFTRNRSEFLKHKGLKII